jgi:drug/metabolite transporter (DMT)-like permease
MDWLALSLLCAFSLASADAATKHWLQGYRAREISLVRFSLAGLLLAPLLLIQPLPELTLNFWGWMLFLVPVEMAAMLLYMSAIRDHPLALTVPYLAFTPLFVAVYGWLMLGEALSPGGLAGILLIVAGAWALNLQPANHGWRPRGLPNPLRAIARSPGARRMLLVSLLYAFTAVGSKQAMQGLPPEQFGALYFMAIGGAALLVFGLREPAAVLGVLVRRPGVHLLVAGLMALMVATHFLAIARVEAAYMIAVKRTSLLFGILYGALLFREAGAGLHLFAGLLMVAGVALIVLGST